jgi:hypothetical protein
MESGYTSGVVYLIVGFFISGFVVGLRLLSLDCFSDSLVFYLRTTWTGLGVCTLLIFCVLVLVSGRWGLGFGGCCDDRVGFGFFCFLYFLGYVICIFIEFFWFICFLVVLLL